MSTKNIYVNKKLGFWEPSITFNADNENAFFEINKPASNISTYNSKSILNNREFANIFYSTDNPRDYIKIDGRLLTPSERKVKSDFILPAEKQTKLLIKLLNNYGNEILDLIPDSIFDDAIYLYFIKMTHLSEENAIRKIRENDTYHTFNLGKASHVAQINSCINTVKCDRIRYEMENCRREATNKNIRYHQFMNMFIVTEQQPE